MADAQLDSWPDAARVKNVEAIPHLLVIAASTVLAIRADDLLEIWQTERCQPIPSAPAFLVGIANWRGAPLPLVDLTVALSLASTSRTTSALHERRIAVVSVEKLVVGLLVDSTAGMLNLEAESCRDPSVITAGRIGEFSLGEFDSPHGIGALVDMGALLDALRVRS